MSTALTAMRTALAEKVTEIKSLESRWADTGSGFALDKAEATAYRTLVDSAEEIKSNIALADRARGIATFADAPAGPDANDAAREHSGRRGGLLSDAVMGSDEFKGMRASGFKHLGHITNIEGALGAQRGAKDVFGGNAGTAGSVTIPGIGRAEQVEPVARVLRPDRVRALFPARTTSAPLLYGIRQTGFTNAARIVPQREVVDAVAQFGRKPKSSLTMETVTYPVVTIAHTLDAHKNAMDDDNYVRDLLDVEMVDGVYMTEDFNLLYGPGGADAMTGIVNTAGVQMYNMLPADTRKSVAIRRAMTRAILAYLPPTGIVLNPIDWEDLELETDDQGALRIAISVAIGAETRIWRMDVVASNEMIPGHFLLGAFGRAAKVYDREQVSVSASSENRDNYERNVITLRAESRVALTVDRPEAFVYGTFSDADDYVAPV